MSQKCFLLINNIYFIVVDSNEFDEPVKTDSEKDFVPYQADTRPNRLQLEVLCSNELDELFEYIFQEGLIANTFSYHSLTNILHHFFSNSFLLLILDVLENVLQPDKESWLVKTSSVSVFDCLEEICQTRCVVVLALKLIIDSVELFGRQNL